MEGGIENLASQGEVITKVIDKGETIEEVVKDVVEEVVDVEIKSIEDESGQTLEEIVYEKSIEDAKNLKQKELDEEINKYKIPEVEEIGDTKETISEDTDPVADYIESKSVEEEVKEVVEEINSEKDLDLQKKQWETLLVSLREDIISLKSDLKEKTLEIKSLTKRQEELIEENNDLKYSGRIKLDDELEHLHYLKEKISKKPDDKEIQKQLALYHAKALNGIYPEYDIQESFNQISERRKNAINALSKGSEGYSETKVVPKTKPNFAVHGVVVK